MYHKKELSIKSIKFIFKKLIKNKSTSRIENQINELEDIVTKIN